MRNLQLLQGRQGGMASTGVVLVERAEWDTSSYHTISIIAADQSCELFRAQFFPCTTVQQVRIRI
jgi:hypothetical protein